MSTSVRAQSKKAKLAGAASAKAAVEEEQPVAGPSSRRPDDGHEGQGEEQDSDDEELDGSDDDDEDEEEDLSGISEGSVSGDENEEDDYEDILQANEDAQSGKKKKRKRALPSQAFGSMLSELIAAPVPTKPLRPLHPPASAEALERRARNALQAQKHDREERGHVSDVIAGWTARPNIPFSQWNSVNLNEQDNNVEYALGGAEKEKELRRLAQRGVVRLFNAIKAAQYTEETVSKSGVAAFKADEGTSRQAIKDASPAPSASGSTGAGLQPVTRASNVLGSRGRQEALTNLSKASFLDLFKSGAKSKTAA